jgi:hypothetical protein
MHQIVLLVYENNDNFLKKHLRYLCTKMWKVTMKTHISIIFDKCDKIFKMWKRFHEMLL